MATDAGRAQQPFYPITSGNTQTPPPNRSYVTEVFGHLAPEPEPLPTLECDYCEGVIRPGESAPEIFFGVSGTVEQTGLPGVIPPPGKRGVTVRLHYECYLEHALAEVCPESAEEILHEMALDLAQEMMQSMKEEELLDKEYLDRIEDDGS